MATMPRPKEYRTTEGARCVGGPPLDPIRPEGDGWELHTETEKPGGTEMIQYRWVWVREQQEGQDRVLTQ